ncbi:MAG: tetratricopeptide repeat protein [Methylococcales bacterium]|jgi:tetratricopeptide (TPR) repeat protein|nr:tetratricopeptide repeat protein [Methylococcales bacterium]MBT7410010.1 tetratricopeptide repeat protein [Methylococcales bacterium]
MNLKINAKNQQGSALIILLVLTLTIVFFIGAFKLKSHVKFRLIHDFPAYAEAETFVINQPQLKQHLGHFKINQSEVDGNFTYNALRGSGELLIPLTGYQGKSQLLLSLYNENQQSWHIEKAILKKQNQKFIIRTPIQYMQQIEEQLNQGQLSLAEDYCETLSLIEKTPYYTKRCNASLAYSSGQMDEYFAIYQQWAKTTPNYYRPHVYLGEVYRLSGHYSKSITAYQQAYKLKNNPEFAAILADLYLSLNDEDEAIKYLNQIKQSSSKSAFTFHSFGRYHLVKKQFDEAIDYFNKARLADKELALPNFGLAYSYRALGQYEKSIYFFERGLILSNDRIDQRFRLISVLIKLKHYDGAIYHLKKIILKQPNEIKSLILLAKLYLKYDRDEEATKLIRHAKKHNLALAERYIETFF